MESLLHRQACTVLVAGGWDGLLVAKRPRLRDRLAARWRARRLDRALAEGTPPEASAALALRAQQLTEPDERRSIALALRRILRDARDSRCAASLRVIRPGAWVTAAREELNRLADALDEPGPVTAGGVAQASLLVTDGTGPLWNPQSHTGLGARAAQATHELRPWPA